MANKIKRREKLKAPAFCRQVVGRYANNGFLIPLLTEGGQPAWLTEVQFDWTSCCERKIGMVKEEIETRGKLTINAFSMQLMSRGWWQQNLILLTI